MSVDHDPRVYFSAERTLLAWIRTGLAIVGLGFVVARFGLFLRMMGGHQAGAPWHSGSAVIGIVLVAVGAVSIALGALKHLRFCQTLTSGERPPRYWLESSVALALVLAILGASLAIYITMTSVIRDPTEHAAPPILGKVAAVYSSP